MSAVHSLILYTRPGCHLCEAAEEWLDDLAEQLDLPLVLINILDDPATYEIYKWRIPVLQAGPCTWDAPLDQATIQPILANLRNQAPPITDS